MSAKLAMNTYNTMKDSPPTYEEINPYGLDDLDGDSAAKRFLGLNRVEAFNLFRRSGLICYSEDLSVMGNIAFEYYLFAISDYIKYLNEDYICPHCEVCTSCERAYLNECSFLKGIFKQRPPNFGYDLQCHSCLISLLKYCIKTCEDIYPSHKNIQDFTTAECNECEEMINYFKEYLVNIDL